MSISAADVKKLRDSTGAGIMDCKRALTETNGDIEKAIEYLRKKGIAKAEKKASRETKDGLVESYVNPETRLGVLLEVNCETDFVAKTADFKNFVRNLTMHIANQKPVDTSELIQQRFISTSDKTIEQAQKELIGKLGENITIKRFELYESKNGLIESYIHPGSKLGVLVEVNCDNNTVIQSTDFQRFVHDVAMQIAASNPMVVKRGELSPEIIEKEMNIYKSQVQNQNKPEHIAEKIAQGKMEKFYQEVCLIEQSFIKDPNKTIQELLKELIEKMGETITIKRFARFQLGE
ncbi:MAG: elongation factor Ts [bacterium]|nr:MAG: elongation factor Ts [bacterium]